jgi:drug/metabolite transporter (DMT)-like permease
MKLITVYLIILIFAWTINPFVKKIITKKIGVNEYNLLLTFFLFIFTLIYYSYLYYKKKYIDLSSLKKLNFKDFGLILFTALNTLLIFVVLCLLINMTEISYLIPQIYCLIIALTFIISYLVFNESFSIKKGLGLFFIIIGIIFLNNKKEKKQIM